MKGLRLSWLRDCQWTKWEKTSPKKKKLRLKPTGNPHTAKSIPLSHQGYSLVESKHVHPLFRPLVLS